tara:strand:+ start:497 stop:1036 length:540 start_codon:yes stop_codon:yes gene_type:complete
MSAPAISQETITWKEDVKGWSINVDTTIDYGCFMSAAYDGGAVLRAQLNPTDDIFQFIIGNGAWQSLESGKLYDMKIQFGNLEPWTGLATAHRFNDQLPVLVFDLFFEEGKADSFINEFMRMTGVRVFYSGNEIANLSLRGTYDAFQEVMACQSQMMERINNSADPFSNPSNSSSDPFE